MKKTIKILSIIIYRIVIVIMIYLGVSKAILAYIKEKQPWYQIIKTSIVEIDYNIILENITDIGVTILLLGYTIINLITKIKTALLIENEELKIIIQWLIITYIISPIIIERIMISYLIKLKKKYKYTRRVILNEFKHIIGLISIINIVALISSCLILIIIYSLNMRLLITQNLYIELIIIFYIIELMVTIIYIEDEQERENQKIEEMKDHFGYKKEDTIIEENETS